MVVSDILFCFCYEVAHGRSRGQTVAEESRAAGDDRKNIRESVMCGILSGRHDSVGFRTKSHGDARLLQHANVILTIPYSQHPFRRKVEFLANMSQHVGFAAGMLRTAVAMRQPRRRCHPDRKSTRLNSRHVSESRK